MKACRTLPFRYAVQLKSAEGWLALGHLDEAIAEWKKLPQEVRQHPDAAPFRQKLFESWRTLGLMHA